MSACAVATGRYAISVRDTERSCRTISLRLTGCAGRLCRALKITHALNAASISAPLRDMTDLTLPAHFRLVGFSTFTDLNITTDIRIFIALLTIGAGKLREIIRESAAEIFNTGIRRRGAALS